MVNQLFFLASLHIMGVALGLTMKKHLPIVFVSITGFLWGMLLWIASSLIWLIMTRQPVIPGALVILAVFTFLILVANIRQRVWLISWRDWIWCVLPLLGFLTIGLTASNWNFSRQTPDSFTQIFLAETLAADGVTGWVQIRMLSWAFGLPLMHSISEPLGIGYLYILQPVTAYCFILTWLYLVYYILRYIVTDVRAAFVLTGASGLLLFSSWGMIFQFTLVHNTLHSAAYLFTGIAALWLGLKEENYAWFTVAVLSFIGFGLFRKETPLMVILFLSILISIRTVPFRVRAVTSLVSVGALLAVLTWFWTMTRNFGSGGVASSASILMQMVALSGFAVFIIMAWVKLPIIPKLAMFLPHLMLVTLGAGIGFGLVWKPDFIWISLNVLIDHLFFSDFWSFVVIALVGLLIISFRSVVPFSQLFTYSIPAFFLLAFLVRLPGNPYRIHWGDSLSRMITYILPIFTLYVCLKLGSLLQFEDNIVHIQQEVSEKELRQRN